MIINEKFINFMLTADDETQGSAYNHVILTCASLGFIDRVRVAVEILLGEKFCRWVSRNQKSCEGETDGIPELHRIPPAGGIRFH